MGLAFREHAKDKERGKRGRKCRCEMERWTKIEKEVSRGRAEDE